MNEDLYPIPEFEQHMNGGRLSPLRSPRQFDNEVKQIETHQAIKDYAAHGYPPNNFS